MSGITLCAEMHPTAVQSTQAQCSSPSHQPHQPAPGLTFSSLANPPKSSRSRALLTKQQAIEIFLKKNYIDHQSSSAFAKEVSVGYGVSEKAVRDIWSGRTWFRDTFHLDDSRVVSVGKLLAKSGRPKGAKDREPRRRRAGLAYHCDQKENAKNEMSRLCESGNIVFEMFDFGVMNWEVERCTAPFEDPFHGDWAYWQFAT